jgi:hypothetical protein
VHSELEAAAALDVDEWISSSLSFSYTILLEIARVSSPSLSPKCFLGSSADNAQMQAVGEYPGISRGITEVAGEAGDT